MYDAIIFDMDGVLVRHSGQEIFEEAAHTAFADLGVSRPTNEQVTTLSQVPTRAIESNFASVVTDHDIDASDLLIQRDERSVEYQSKAAQNGAKEPYEDVEVVKNLTSPLGVVSNNQQGTVEAVLSIHGLESNFETMYGRAHGLEGLHRRKPDPHYLKQAIADLGVEEVLYVGDSTVDMIAADRAGVDSAFLRRFHREETELPLDPEFDVPDLKALTDQLNPP